MKWFSISGIIQELQRVRWPKPSELAKKSGIVLLFTASFALFFVLCELITVAFIRFIGM